MADGSTVQIALGVFGVVGTLGGVALGAWLQSHANKALFNQQVRRENIKQKSQLLLECMDKVSAICKFHDQLTENVAGNLAARWGPSESDVKEAMDLFSEAQIALLRLRVFSVGAEEQAQLARISHEIERLDRWSCGTIEGLLAWHSDEAHVDRFDSYFRFFKECIRADLLELPRVIREPNAHPKQTDPTI